MFNIIDGGFRFIIDGLFTMDFSWLFMFSSLTATNIVVGVVKLGKKIKNKGKQNGNTE